MYGIGILKGMAVTLKHFIESYTEDLRWFGKRYYTEEGINDRRNYKTKGIFTVQYPEEKLPVPEEFRYLPFLIFDFDEDGVKRIRCTSCGICAKVCPPQCIWIVRTSDPETGRPVPEPAEFYIDIDICMNCGFCAEYCPFDAIKMDHNYELAAYDRQAAHIYAKDHLLQPTSYYAGIRPLNYAKEESDRQQKEAAKDAKRAVVL